MIRSRLPALARPLPLSLLLLLLLLAGCGDRPHVAGTNLPRWAACWFPHRANPAAVRRAQPCPAEAAATTVYTARDIQGCWLVTGADGAPPYDSPFFSGPLRLTDARSAELRRQVGEEREVYDVQPLASIPDSMAFDTAMMVTYWRFAAPDSLEIIRSAGFMGLHLSFRVRGDSLVGMGRGFQDEIKMSTDTTTDPVPSFWGRRVACPRVEA